MNARLYINCGCHNKTCKPIPNISFWYNAFRKSHDIRRQCNDNGISCTEPMYGQPTHKTHPHLLNNNELLSGINADEFKSRRDRYMELLCNESRALYGTETHNIVIIPSATKLFMSQRIPYVFRQNSDFLYFSGCLEPDTALILTGNSAQTYVSTFFARKQDNISQLWEGPRTGIESAPTLFSVDEAFHMEELPNFLSKIANKYPKHVLYYGTDHPIQPALHDVVQNYVRQNTTKVSSLGQIFAHKLRLIKSNSEQNLMKKSCEIASEAIAKTISITHPGISEHQLFATVDYESRMRGADILAYPPVVASGNNATIIHYINNKQIARDGDLILMDAGCEYHGYCSDITRTWPANGKFNRYQKVLYEILLEVQIESIKLCAERIPLDTIYSKMLRLLGHHLKEQKILKQDINTSFKLNQIMYEICPHHIGHYLGMDVHDVGTVGRNIQLQPGMVVTIEPGIYIRNNMKSVCEEFRDVGLRIEDDVLITDTDYQVLSSNCPKTVEDIESVLKK